MFSQVTTVLKAGGFTLLLLFACSLLAVAVAIERIIALWNIQTHARALMDVVRRCLYRGAVAEARAACERSRSPAAEFFLVGFERRGRSSAEALGAAVDRERQRVALSLRGPLWILGTVGATAPFIGLFGTVVGIMAAFEAIGRSKQAGIEVVGPGIAEALIATAVGIGVAVVALVFFNYFQSRLARINVEMKLAAEEFVELLRELPPEAVRAEPTAPGPDEGKAVA
ncbi:MAG: MotA/TolQ/ExbB proton channel family protein [Myxococcales bacterium]|nr:MotA/TolQ/ExbB proton channel family protein [Myxococcota bacterium]MDW8280565.1 MotA/TolQ/ExbB proton channel family protein [Myxococcales bacterium]